MNDFDRLLSESLKGAGSSYSPRNALAAREEFATRRRRRFVWQLSGGVALAGAAVAAALFFASAEPLRDESKPGPSSIASALAVVSRFGVGDDPIAIGGGEGVLWIANKADGSVDRIDLTTGVVEPIPLDEANEIAVGGAYAWISGPDGDYVRISTGPGGEPEHGSYVKEMGGAEIVDMAVGGHPEGAAWAVDTEGCIWELTTPAGGCGDENLTDVATDVDETWVLASNEGFARFHDGDPAAQEGRPSEVYFGLPAGPYGDMVIAGDALWVSGGGRVVRVDLATSARRELELEGDYADLAVGENTVWALAGHDNNDPKARVYELSNETDGLEIVGVSELLTGEPSDLIADAGGVWVTIRETDEVVYISREGDTAPPVVTPEPEKKSAKGEHGAVVMVFGKDGDIWAAYADGSIAPLTQTPNEEAFPVLIDSLDGTESGAVIFERGFEGGPPKLIHIELATMVEEELVEGYRPAAGSPGEQAWLGTSASVPQVIVGTLFSDFPDVLTIEDENGEPVQLSQLAWDHPSATWLYGLTTGKSPGSVVEIAPEGNRPEVIQRPRGGARYTAVAPANTGGAVTVLRVCCDNADGPITVELVELFGFSGRMNYRTIADISDLPWAGFDDMTLTPATGLSATPTQEEVVWGPSDGPAWVVSDGVRGFLVNDHGEAQVLPWEIHGGADVNENRNLL